MPGPSNYYPGVYRGTVFSNRDPLNQGRLRLKVPQLFADQHTEWAWPLDHEGLLGQTPEVGQGIWVMFEGGDPAYPVWMGTFGATKYAGSEVYLPTLEPGVYPDTIERTDFRSKTGLLNVTATLIAMAEKIEELEQRITALEA